jgi:hypothetical protein
MIKFYVFLAIQLALFATVCHAGFEAKLLHIKGKVKVVRDRKTLKAHKGMELFSGDKIKCARKSLAIIRYGKKSTIKVDERTSLSISTLVSVDTGKPKEQGVMVKLLNGSFMMDYSRAHKDEQVKVEMKSVALGVRGTRFFVSSSGQGEKHAHAAVERGQVNIYDFAADDYEVIAAGTGVVVDGGRAITKPAAFDWVKKMNWSVSDQLRGSGFRAKEFRKARVSEVKKKIKNLRKRVRKKIKAKLKRQWNKVDNLRGKARQKIKSKLNNKALKSAKRKRDRLKKRKQAIEQRKKNMREFRKRKWKKELKKPELPNVPDLLKK